VYRAGRKTHLHATQPVAEQGNGDRHIESFIGPPHDDLTGSEGARRGGRGRGHGGLPASWPRLWRGPRRQRLGDGWRRRPRRAVRGRSFCGGAGSGVVASSPHGLPPPGPSRRRVVGPEGGGDSCSRVGHGLPGEVVGRGVALPAQRRSPGLHGHLPLDRSRESDLDRAAHEPCASLPKGRPNSRPPTPDSRRRSCLHRRTLTAFV
jgi:hypothetical protein